jgi:hypothetical protein
MERRGAKSKHRKNDRSATVRASTRVLQHSLVGFMARALANFRQKQCAAIGLCQQTASRSAPVRPLGARQLSLNQMFGLNAAQLIAWGLSRRGPTWAARAKVLFYAGFAWIKTGWVCQYRQSLATPQTVTGVHSGHRQASCRCSNFDVADTVDKFMNLGRAKRSHPQPDLVGSGRRR